MPFVVYPIIMSIVSVNYAAAVAFEVRQPNSGGELVLRFNFKNGTDDDGFRTYNFLNGSGDVPLSTFVNYLAVRTSPPPRAFDSTDSNDPDPYSLLQ